jgi:transcriptional regulator
MYNLPYYKESDNDVILGFIQKHPFAFLAGCDDNQKPVATQVPVFLEEREGVYFLTGHIMRQTNHHKAFQNNSAVLVVFSGPHTYVSATWYSNPSQASTWNYMSVHAKGKIKFLDEEGLVNVLKKTTLHFENNNAASTTVFENLATSYTQPLMKAIAAFEIEVETIEHVFKLSQDRDEASYLNIIARLNEQGGDGKQIAEEMKQRASQLFEKSRDIESNKYYQQS